MMYFLSKEAHDFLINRKHPLMYDYRIAEKIRNDVEIQQIPIVKKWHNVFFTRYGDPHCDNTNTFTLEDTKMLINVFDKWEIDKEFID